MTTATHTFAPSALSIATGLRDWFAALTKSAYEASSIVQDLERIHALSDEELAASGLNRETATHNVVARYGFI